MLENLAAPGGPRWGALGRRGDRSWAAAEQAGNVEAYLAELLRTPERVLAASTPTGGKILKQDLRSGA